MILVISSEFQNNICWKFETYVNCYIILYQSINDIFKTFKFIVYPIFTTKLFYYSMISHYGLKNV